jgi:uncharacterized membrane protein
MTLATSAVAGEDRASRWILLASLALNLFLVGAGGAVVARHYLADPATKAAPLDRSVAARVERLAATLPAPDAEKLRAEYRANAATVDAARETYYRTQDEVRRTLRAEPFEPEAMRAAMVRTRATRQAFDQLLQEVIASAAVKMSAAGRDQLANWPPSQRGADQAKR